MALIDDNPYEASEKSRATKKSVVESALALFEATNGRMRFTTIDSREKIEITLEFPKIGREDTRMAEIIRNLHDREV